MAIRTDAVKWFKANFNSEDKVYTSKFYLPEESWPKIPVWWFQIPPNAIDEKFATVNLVCQVAPLADEFYCLIVPVSFFVEHQEKFHHTGEIISIYLSAESKDLFTERRGNGAIDFSEFKIN